MLFGFLCFPETEKQHIYQGFPANYGKIEQKGEKKMKKMNLPAALFTKSGSRCVLLLHAYTGSSNDVRMLSRFLEKQGYSTYSPIFEGHGTLNPLDILEQNPDSWWQNVRDALAFLKKEGYQQVAVFGLSMGGVFAMRALETEQQLVGGGFFCSPIFPVKTNVPENFGYYAEHVLQAAGVPEDEIKERLIAYSPMVETQLATIMKASQQVADHLDDIQVPIFMAQAGQDELIDATGIFKTAAALKNTRYVLQWYPESTHVITVGRDHRQLEQDVVSFLDTLPWREEEE